MEYGALLRRLIEGGNLTQDEAAAFAGEVMDGNYSPAQAAGLLVALAAKGETVDEIAGAARAMRERSVRVEHDLPTVVDVVGTGGDHANTVNISTMAALVVAAAGIPVAKHGNRAASSACGSADVLEAAGFPLEIAPERAAAMLRSTGFTFMFAPRYHPAMRNAAVVRRELGVRTIFNLLGPLTNPAAASHVVVGVAREQLVERIGETLRALGARRGAVVHGRSGVDEVAADAPTLVYQFDEGGARLHELRPADFGMRASVAMPTSHSVADACRTFTEVLGGAPSPAADVVAMNAAMVFHAIGTEEKLPSAYERARELLQSGAVWPVFERSRAMAIDG